MASTSGLVLAGYYLANENIKDLRYVQLSECLLYSVKGIKVYILFIRTQFSWNFKSMCVYL